MKVGLLDDAINIGIKEGIDKRKHRNSKKHENQRHTPKRHSRMHKPKHQPNKKTTLKTIPSRQ